MTSQSDVIAVCLRGNRSWWQRQPRAPAYWASLLTHDHNNVKCDFMKIHWKTERRVPELIPVLGSQPAGDVSHKPGGRQAAITFRQACSYPCNPSEGC